LGQKRVLVRRQVAVLPVDPVLRVQQVAAKHSTELEIERRSLADLAHEPVHLSPVCSAQARNLQVEIAPRRVVSKVVIQGRLPCQLFEFTSSLLLNCVEQLFDSVDEVGVRGQADDLGVHVSGLLKLEGHISFEEHEVERLGVAQVVGYDLALLQVILNQVSAQLQRTCNVLPRHDQEVFVANGALRQRKVEMLRVLRRDYKLFFDFRIVPAKPAVFVLLNLNPSHFVIYFENGALEWLPVVLTAHFSAHHTFKGR